MISENNLQIMIFIFDTASRRQINIRSSVSQQSQSQPAHNPCMKHYKTVQMLSCHVLILDTIIDGHR